jgi:pSer/pThr/pTyr-binding forkhead associated (FHA) protein
MTWSRADPKRAEIEPALKIPSVGGGDPEFIEVWSTGPVRLVPLEGDQITVGRDPESGVPLPDDDRTSRFHAVFQRYSVGWAIRDLGSTNGTFVNGQSVVGERALRPGDEIRIGHSRIVIRRPVVGGASRQTVTEQPVPKLTRREKDVLIALCWPLLHGNAFGPPATVAEVAETLHVSAGAVKTHFSNLYDKFGLHDAGGDRRAKLAQEAINRHAVDITDLPSEASQS